MEEEIRIDFRALFKIIWKEKWWIMLITTVVTALGVTYALLAREEFETQGKILPELQGKGAGNLSQFAGLASLAGIDLSSMGGTGVDAVRPDLYPDVITSTPFYLELFKTSIHTRADEKMTFEKYYHIVIEEGEKPKEKLLKIYPVKEEGIIVLNRLNEIRLKDLRKRITAGIDKKTGVITINTTMPDPVVAAEVAKFAMEYLMEYVKSYRTEKLRQDVDYLENQVKTSRGKYYSTQEKKARYTDQFQDMRLQSADVQRERIESEYKLSSSFYNELLKKYEEAKFKLHQETPVFKVLEPPLAPAKRTKPKRSIIAIGFAIFGGAIGFGSVLIKKENYRRVLKRNN
ncbi:Wzz/FepE/Etk N-terminal domain-containing protein [Leadbetterella sp. DM7]|uniref:Wzz/FepE/Etk N-terminal domain-containing protein n=1 Tax=Leadbetterella sp. DM7 TaxID=3235085 RepID=UPI00349E87A7